MGLQKSCSFESSMSKLTEIKSTVQDELKIFDKHFKSSMKSSLPLLDKITRFIVKRKGKQMRPIFVFLSANICGGIHEKLIGLLHLSSFFTQLLWFTMMLWMIQMNEEGFSH